MISASEIHELRFEKAAFGYKQEDIDEFLNKLEEEAAIAQRELDDSNNKIQVLADKVREYMRDEDALELLECLYLKLFQLQIINGEDYLNTFTYRMQKHSRLMKRELQRMQKNIQMLRM